MPIGKSLCDSLTLWVPVQRCYPSPYGFNPIIWLKLSLHTLYPDCIILIYWFRICQHNFSFCHTIIRDCQDAIPRSVNILSTSLSLRTPFRLPPNRSNRFQCTIFTLPCPATRVIMKTGNPTCDNIGYWLCWYLHPIVLQIAETKYISHSH